MIQNVDKNGEPEEDDKEMKFLESEKPEEGEEAVSKGTLIIASSKPKGMMCPEPLMFNGGGTGTDGDPMGGMGEPTGPAGPAGPNQPNETMDEMNTLQELQENREKQAAKDRDTSLDSGDETDNLDPLGFGGFTELDMAYATSPERGTGTAADIAEQAMYGIGKFAEEVLGFEITEKDAKAREQSEKEASKPGDSDDDDLLDGKIDDKDIKVNKVNDVIADLKEKNVYIPGVGYFPLQGLMSPQDTTI